MFLDYSFPNKLCCHYLCFPYHMNPNYLAVYQLLDIFFVLREIKIIFEVHIIETLKICDISFVSFDFKIVQQYKGNERNIILIFFSYIKFFPIHICRFS